MWDILWLPNNVLAATVDFDTVCHRAEFAVFRVENVKSIHGEFVLVDVICERAKRYRPEASGIPGHFVLLPVIPCSNGRDGLCAGSVEAKRYPSIRMGFRAVVVGWILLHRKVSFMRCYKGHAGQIRQGSRGIHPASRYPTGSHLEYMLSIRGRCPPLRARANLPGHS